MDKHSKILSELVAAIGHLTLMVAQLHRAVHAQDADRIDICGFCGFPGADKIPYTIRWPGERAPGTDLVHDECEQAECRCAHARLSEKERADFLRTIYCQS